MSFVSKLEHNFVDGHFLRWDVASKELAPEYHQG